MRRCRNTITIRPKHIFEVPVEAQCVTPDNFAGKTVDEIASLQVWEGNRKKALSELFVIEGKANAKSEKVSIRVLEGLGKVRKIGADMSAGEIIIEGEAGMHLGKGMRGGTITVTGDASSWIGSMMRGGTIEIKGNAGDYVGAPYRGSTMGMRGGVIIVHGNAGNEVGCFMRGGLIKIHGNIGQFAGIHMRNGTIIVQGNSEEWAGAEMLGGKIIVCGHISSILPTFTIDGFRPKVKVNKEKVTGPFYRFIGDLVDGGDGKLYVSQAKNPHLKTYEEYL